jgi:hypothetical protein
MAEPPIAAAHGPVAPVATSYVAKLRNVPRGLDAKIVDAYVRLWLRVSPHLNVVILDYHAAPYLRFDTSGVQVNENSEMYYLNQTPYPWAVPPGLTRTTPPRWTPASSGHSYEWHDGRLQALASVALPAGASFAGHWRIPLLVNGRPASITGGLWHVANPSIVWFWLLAVMLLCCLAAWRVRSPALDARAARTLGVVALVALELACTGRELHGRPGVSVAGLIELAAVSVFALWQLQRILAGRLDFFRYLLIALVALWQGLDLFPVLTYGYVLVDLPDIVARAAAVVCLASGVALFPIVFRLDELAHVRAQQLLRRGPRAAANREHADSAQGAS